ncbi:MAG: hypothetical protein IJY56_00010 [Clostridia bacterium]|nr:hypothetical protein [Clostridia bacterium]
MKKCLRIAVILLSLLLFAGCSEKPADGSKIDEGSITEVEGLVFRAEQEEYGGALSSLTLTVENNTGDEVTYGEAYTAQRFEDGEWKTVPFGKDGGWFIEIAYKLPDGESAEVVIDLAKQHSEALSDGRYRIIKNFYLSAERAEDGSKVLATLAAEFTVSEQ